VQVKGQLGALRKERSRLMLHPHLRSVSTRTRLS
jgi:hypothetical protein